MNKRKIAIFVEGETELVFVRNFLNAWYNYDIRLLGFECYKLHSNQSHTVPFALGSRESENFYQIIIVGNDNITGKILSRAAALGRAGFTSIVGLRDMFCNAYHKHSPQGRTVSSDLNEHFIQIAHSTIESSGLPNRSDIHIHFAIMEIEAWLLGMDNILAIIDYSLNITDVHEQIGVDLSQDPEMNIYHPAVVMKKLFELTGKSYDKHTDDSEKIISQLMRADFEQLYHSGKCQSFHEFVDAII